MNRKRLGSRLLLLLGSMIFALLLAEISLRILNWYSPASFHLSPPNAEMRDVETDWDVTYHTNGEGLRDDEYTAAKPGGILRIVVIGDSFTYGQGCQRGEIFPDLLEEQLKSDGYRAQVINVSQVGIGPESYFVLLKDVALKYQPDVVVLNTFGNDASEVKGTSLPALLVRSLSHYSHLFVLLRVFRSRASSHSQADFWSTVEQKVNNNKPEGALTPLADFRKQHGEAPNNLVAASVTNPEEVIRWIDTPTDGEGWSQFQNYVGTMNDICQKHGITFVIGVIPDGAQVDPRQLLIRQKLGVPIRNSVLSETGKFQQLVRDYAAKKSILCFDPLKEFREGGSGLYFPTDLHWSPSGHRLYASLLEKFLSQNVLANRVNANSRVVVTP